MTFKFQPCGYVFKKIKLKKVDLGFTNLRPEKWEIFDIRFSP